MSAAAHVTLAPIAAPDGAPARRHAPLVAGDAAVLSGRRARPAALLHGAQSRSDGDGRRAIRRPRANLRQVRAVVIRRGLKAGGGQAWGGVQGSENLHRARSTLCAPAAAMASAYIFNAAGSAASTASSS